MLENRRIARLPYRDAGGEACEAPLTAQQQNALEFLFPLLDAHTPKAALLRGVTAAAKRASSSNASDIRCSPAARPSYSSPKSG